MPITPERTPLGRVYVGHQDVENSVRLKPFTDPGHHLPRLIEMFEHVETGNDIERSRWKWSIKNAPDKDLGAGFCFRSSRDFSRHLNSVELPGFASHELQERSRTATQVQERTGLLILRNGLQAESPAPRRVLARGR